MIPKNTFCKIFRQINFFTNVFIETLQNIKENLKESKK
ncbi:hypothetical protein AC5_A0224 [Clostridium perfringens CPE str. F4969]|nr:hypothetical protein AC5_A0224 [Clostridium perfringens CPE str. F4969]